MHARELAELAALVAVHSRLLIDRPGRIDQRAIEEYWSASKCRLERWLRLLQQLVASDHASIRPPTLTWPRVRPVLEEILTSELLARIAAAASVAYDAARSDQDLEPIARNILSGHLDARRRLLLLLADGRALSLPETSAIDRLRRRVERWGDMLLAHLADAVEIEEFAFVPARARDFAEDLDREAAQAERNFTCQLVLASLRASFATDLADRAPSADLNRRIGMAVVDWFGDELREASGPVQSLWLDRLSRTASETEEMLEELMRLEANSQ